MSRFSAYGSLAALITAAALSSGAAQADPLFAFLTPTAQTPQVLPQYAPQLKRHRTQTRNSIRACNGRSWLTPQRKRPVPSSSIRPTPCSIMCSAEAERSATASASAARASRGLASSRSRARPSGRIGIRRSKSSCDGLDLPRMTAGGPGQSARRPRHVSRRHRISHPRQGRIHPPSASTSPRVASG